MGASQIIISWFSEMTGFVRSIINHNGKTLGVCCFASLRITTPYSPTLIQREGLVKASRAGGKTLRFFFFYSGIKENVKFCFVSWPSRFSSQGARASRRPTSATLPTIRYEKNNLHYESNMRIYSTATL